MHICNSGIDTKIRILKIIVCMFLCGITVSIIYCINLGDIRLMISDKIQNPNAIIAYFNVDFLIILSSWDISTSYYLNHSLSLLYFM